MTNMHQHRNLPRGFFLVFSLLALPIDIAYSHTLRNRISGSNSSDGVRRSRIKSDLSMNLDHSLGNLTQTTYGISASTEQYAKDDITDDEYAQQVYGSRKRQTDGVTANAGQTWAKLTDTRLIFATSTDGKTTSKTGGVGISHWFWHENLQLSLDVSRSLVKQPVFETLDADSDVISPPPLLTSTGTTVASKYLASPTTVTSLSYTHVEKNDRPPTHVYTGGIKKFITSTKSALHLDVARAFNHGRITTKSSYGEVNAWIAEAAFLQTLSRHGTNGKISYRYYREDETTRVNADKFTRGSDLVSLFISQDLSSKFVDSLSSPLTVEASAARYKTNELEDGKALVANLYEVGLLAKF